MFCFYHGYGHGLHFTKDSHIVEFNTKLNKVCNQYQL